MRPDSNDDLLRRTIPGRALYVAANGDLYIGRGYQIYRSQDAGQHWEINCSIPSSGWKHYCSQFRVMARLLRRNVAAFHAAADGVRVAVARDGIYRAAATETTMKRVFEIQRGSRPLNLTVDQNRVLFGEYGSGLEDEEVIIYVSDDGGQSFHAGFRFPRGDIRHVHNILVDPVTRDYWVLVGDFGRQTGIGLLSRDLKHLEWLGRGTQRYRAVSAFVDPDCLTYGTDSDRDYNFIVRLDKQSGRIDELQPVEGSSLHTAQFGNTRLISTAVEPNPYCRSKECCLYSSTDSLTWQRLIVHQKDRLSAHYFQFGTIVLPYTNDCERGPLMYSGQAVKGFDDRVVILDPSHQSFTQTRPA